MAFTSSLLSLSECHSERSEESASLCKITDSSVAALLQNDKYSSSNNPLTLPLLVLGVITDNPDDTAPFHDLALFTSDFDGSFYFHIYLTFLLVFVTSIPRRREPRWGGGGFFSFTLFRVRMT